MDSVTQTATASTLAKGALLLAKTLPAPTPTTIIARPMSPAPAPEPIQELAQEPMVQRSGETYGNIILNLPSSTTGAGSSLAPVPGALTDEQKKKRTLMIAAAILLVLIVAIVALSRKK